MSRIVLKRILLLSLLGLSILTLTIYGYYFDNHDDSLTEYVNNRDQSDDYERLFDNTNVKTFTLHFSETVFETMITNMQTHFDIYGDYIDNTMYPVDMTYRDSSDSFTIKDVGFRTKSATSRNLLRTKDWRDRDVYHQTTFQLEFNETFDYLENSNMWSVLKTREVFNLEQLNFEYTQLFEGEYDEAMITQAYAHDLYQAADLIVSNASYCIVYLEIGDFIVDYGFYTIIEPIDSEFIKNHFESDLALEYGDLYKVTDVLERGDLSVDNLDLIGIDTDDYRYTYSLRNNTLDGTRTNFNNMEYFIEKLNDFEYFKENYDDLIDADLFARYLAIAFLVGNTDDIRYNQNNYYLYFDVYTNKVTFIPFDLDNTLGFGKHKDLSGNYGVEYSVFFNDDKVNILVDNFLKVDELNQLYLEYIEMFITDFFHYDRFYDAYIEARDLYETILINEFHLGNKMFGLRNTAWYFTEKISHVTAELQEKKG